MNSSARWGSLAPQIPSVEWEILGNSFVGARKVLGCEFA
jgi:hypothetical protein